MKWTFFVAPLVWLPACFGVAEETPNGPIASSAPNEYRVKVTTDVKYGEGALADGGVKDLLLDVYQPIGSTDKAKAVFVMIHGGAYMGGDKAIGTGEKFVRMAQQMTKRGFVCCSINYRMVPDDPPTAPKWWIDIVRKKYGGKSLDDIFRDIRKRYEQQGGKGKRDSRQVHAKFAAIQDAFTAVRYVRANAETYAIDKEKIYVTGSSAGGAICAYLALDDAEKFASKNPANHPQEKSHVNLACCMSGAMGNINEIGKGDDCPLMIVHGKADDRVFYSQALRLRDALKKNQSEFWFRPHPFGHGSNPQWANPSGGSGNFEDWFWGSWLEFIRQHET